MEMGRRVGNITIKGFKEENEEECSRLVVKKMRMLKHDEWLHDLGA